MNSYSKRIWVLVLGIAVAMVIAGALLFSHNFITARKPVGPHNLTPPSPTQLIKKTLEKIELKKFF
jgi:hypothetical protein